MKCWRKAKQKEKKGEVGKLIEISEIELVKGWIKQKDNK